jgi:predicted DNA-binding transcriptional regulator AlpA
MTTNPEDPRFVTIAEWVRRTGISRAKTYELLADKILKSHKIGARTLLDFTAGVAWIDAQPPAVVSRRFKAPVKTNAH